MDLIYANEKMVDIGVLHDYEFDLAFGADENDFELNVKAERHCCKAGYFVYIEGTEYGGLIDGIKSETADKDVTYIGRTWHGLLGSKIITPAQGSLKISGSADSCLSKIISRIGLGNLFTVATSSANISNHEIEAYSDAYTAITEMLKSANLRLQLQFMPPKVVLSAVQIKDYSQDEQFDSDLMEFKIKKCKNTVNHLVCIGAEKDDGSRYEVHLYADGNGEVSQKQTFFGLDEYAMIYERTHTKKEEDLIKYGTDKLEKEWMQDEVDIDFDDKTDRYGIGDIIGAYENATEMEVTAPIIKKIVTVKNGQITISYEVGEQL